MFRPRGPKNIPLGRKVKPPTQARPLPKREPAVPAGNLNIGTARGLLALPQGRDAKM